MIAKKLCDIVKLNGNFKNAINLYLNLNKCDKVDSYIPTKSSVNILERYLNAVYTNKSQSTILIGSYGKGKSHLLLVLLAIFSMKRTKDNNGILQHLIKKVSKVDRNTAYSIKKIWNNKDRFLPIIILNGQEDLNQTFMVALNDALKREGLTELMPETFFSYALDTIQRWKNEYPETYNKYRSLLTREGMDTEEMEAGLKKCVAAKLHVFKSIYPELTAGSVFNPLAGSEVLPMYKSVADKIKEEYGYSGIYIVFDEFSKFIEGQDKHLSGNNMKLLQDMCELANESKGSQIFMTMVAHKSIKEYGKYLTDATINAFTGIEGRIEEVYFVTSSKNHYELIQNAIQTDDEKLSTIPQADKFFSRNAIEKYYRLAAFKSAFTIEDFERIIVRGCYPLSPVSAYALLNISEKVAQNERTLFTFISKEEPYSMAKYIMEHPSVNACEWLITPDLIYDYFKNIFKKEISNEFIHNEWLNAEYAITKVTDNNQTRILKTLALLNIINKIDEIPATEEILITASGVPEGKDTLEILENKRLIYKKGSNNCYAFKTRAGIELKNEIKRRRELKGDNINIANIFGKISEMQYVLPKRYNYEFSMTRYFRYEYISIVEFLKIDNPEVFFTGPQYQDGKVLLLYSLDDIDNTKAVKEKIGKFDCGNLIILFSKTNFHLTKQAKDYEIIQGLKEDTKFITENEVFLKELSLMEEDLEKEIYKFIEDEFGDDGRHLTAYYDGEEWRFESSLSIEKTVDIVCQHYYSKTMVINNELINKQFINSAPIKKARKTIVDTIINKDSDEVFLKGTSAEATIYRAVMVNTGIKSGKLKANVAGIMKLFEDYLDSCIEKKNPISNLAKVYSGKLYGMRSGILPILLAYAIESRNEDLIVYYGDKEVQIGTDTIMSMCDHADNYSLFISKEDAEKEIYLKKLSILFDVDSRTNLNGTRIFNIFTCMQRWYRALPQNAKNIKRCSDYCQDETLIKKLPKIRNLLQQVDVNVYEAIFQTLPSICSDAKDYNETVVILSSIKTLLNGYMEWLLNSAIKNTILIFDKRQKENLPHTLRNWFDKQSDFARNGLHDSASTGLMNCIADIRSYDDQEIVQKMIKVVTEVYIDAWNDDSFCEYIDKLTSLKNEIESLGERNVEGKHKLTFTGKNGELLYKYYENVDESTGAILRNILDDTLEDFSDLSINDKVAILIETIEKVLNERIK